MPNFGSHYRQRFSDFLPVTIVVVAGLILSVAVFLTLRGYYFSLDRQQFQRDAANYSASFKNDVERHVASLAAIHAFVSASHDVNRWEFSVFAHQILPQNSGFKAVLWIPQVGQTQRKDFEVNMQRDGLYGLRLRELTKGGKLIDAGTRTAYLPVAYVEPFESSGDLIGVDLSQNATYAQLIQDARKAGRQVASRPIAQVLVKGAKPPVVLVVFPLNWPKVPRVGSSSDGTEGYVLGILQLNGVIDDAIGARAPILAGIAYGDPARPAVFVAGQRDQTNSLDRWISGAEFNQKVTFSVAGKPFYLVLRSAGRGDPLMRVYAPMGAALLVLALITMLAQSMVATLLRKREVERAVIDRTSELRASNETLSKEVKQRREAEAALRIAKEKAEAANRAKSTFLATMSHELRTPLNAIIGFSSILSQKHRAFDARSEDYLQEINASGIRLLDLINDILEITQMDTEVSGSADMVFLPDIIDSAMANILPTANKQGVSLQTSIADSLPPLRGDAKRLQKALVNLLSNAVKFSKTGGWARISAYRDQDCLIVEVSDDGVGMPPDAELIITHLFSQCDGSLSRKHEGVGLGLNYVQRVAHCHDAFLKVSSRLGKGTTVALKFPAHRLAKALEVA